jgi:hypothetical protein
MRWKQKPSLAGHGVVSPQTKVISMFRPRQTTTPFRKSYSKAISRIARLFASFKGSTSCTSWWPRILRCTRRQSLVVVITMTYDAAVFSSHIHGTTVCPLSLISIITTIPSNNTALHYTLSCHSYDKCLRKWIQCMLQFLDDITTRMAISTTL